MDIYEEKQEGKAYRETHGKTSTNPAADKRAVTFLVLPEIKLAAMVREDI
jgi:hypothetical protein